MTQLYTNNAISLLENAISSSDLEIHLIPGDGDLFPQPLVAGDFFLVTLENETAAYNEIIRISDRIGDVLHIDPTNGRGYENTAIRNWPVNTLVDHRVTASTFREMSNQVLGSVTPPDTNNIVAPSSTKIGDVFDTTFPNNLSCKWIVTVFDQATGKISICELLAVYRGTLNDPAFTVFAKTGDLIRYSIDVIAVGTQMQLKITNTDSIDLLINSIRLNY